MKKFILIQIISLVSMALAGFFFTACQSTEETQLSLDVKTITVAQGGGVKIVAIQSNVSWTVYSSESWVEILPSSGEGNANIQLVIRENGSQAVRTADVRVSAGSLAETIRVTQDGLSAPYLELNTSAIPSTVPSTGGDYDVQISSNTSWQISTSAASSWCSLSALSGSGNASIQLIVSENGSESVRTADIRVSAGSLTETIRVTQDGLSAPYLELNTSAIPSTVPATGGDYDVQISSNTSWQISTSAASSWCSLSALSGSGNETLSIIVQSNASTVTRTCSLSVAAGVIQRWVVINQAATSSSSDYYESAKGKSGAALRTALFNIIKNHTVISYDGLWAIYTTTDTMMRSGTVYIWDMYSTKADKSANYYYQPIKNQCGNYSGEGSCYNREHSVPKSWFNDASPMYSDAFHLVPTDGYVNGRRGNDPFGEVGTASWTSSNGSKSGAAKSGLGYSGNVFEPIDAYKGDFARNYFYMAICYMDKCSSWGGGMFGTDNSGFKTWAANMLMRWHQNDAVSQKELNRNNEVYKSQRNRNPFIDHPELVDYIWGTKQSEIWTY